jgi:outer membrane protein TolC
MIGDTLSHASLAGITIGLMSNQNPILGAFIFTSVCGALIEFLRTYFKKYTDLILTIVMSLSVGTAITIISSGKLHANADSFMFGSILTVTQFDKNMVLILSAISVLTLVFLYHQMIYIAYDEEAAKVGVSLTKIESERIKEEVVYGVKKAYFEYLMTKDNLIMREKLLEKAKEKQKLVRTLYNAGLQPALDVTQMDVSYSQAMLDFERAKNDEKIHMSSLYTALGVRERDDIVFGQVEKENLPEIKYSMEELNTLALLYSPELRIFTEKKKISRLNIEIAEADRRPSVFISIGLGLENKALFLFNDDKGEFSDNFKKNNWEPVFTTAITASLPVYYGGAIIAHIDSAAVEYNRLVYEERGVQIKVRNNIERQYESIDELKKQMQISKMIIENSEKHALLARRNYENGVTALLDLQNAESGVISAQLEYLSCVYQYYMTLAAISHILGVGEEKICQK